MTADPRSAQWFIDALDAMDEMVIIKGHRSRLLWANRAFRELYDLSNDDLVKLIDADHVDPDDTLQYVRDDHQVFTTGKPLEVTEPVHAADGRVLYVDTRKTVIRDAAGEIERTVGVSRIAKSKDKIEASEDKRIARKTTATVLRAVIGGLPLPVVLLDAQSRVAAASAGFDDLIGLEDCEGKAIDDLFAGGAVLRASIGRVTDGGDAERIEKFEIPRRKRLAHVHVQTWALPDGTCGGTLLTFNDVTEIRQQAQRLERTSGQMRKVQSQAAEQRDYLMAILENLPTGVVALDATRTFTLYNPEAATVLHREPFFGLLDDWENPEFCDKNEKRLPLAELPLVKATQGITTRNELFFIPAANSETKDRWLDISAIPMSDGGVVGVITDLTDRIRMQRELEEFAYVTSHDLQEPARMVRSFMQLLEAESADKLEGKALTYLHFAKDGAIRMQNLIQDLLEFSRSGSRPIEKRPTRLAEVVEAAIADLGDLVSTTKAQINVAADLPEVNADERALTHVFGNLLGNAIKFVDSDAMPQVDISAEELGSVWRIVVRDRGIGVDPRFSDRIFKMFQRLHPREDYDGTGIGLALCKRLIEKHDGRIGIDQVEPGSEFWFTIPK